MGRFFVFFILVLVLTRVLGHVPVIGVLFARTGLIGVWITAILLSVGMTRWGERTVRVRKSRSQLSQLLQVDTPHNHGKAGRMLLAQGQARAALEHLESATEGEPDQAEWHYRLGQAYLDLRRFEEASTFLTRALELDPEHAYGSAQLSLAEVSEALGQLDDALAALETFERNHGPTPESSYRRGQTLLGLNRKDDARRAFDSVATLAIHTASYQQAKARVWAMKAKFAALRC
ncbi:MAG: tetratricopeptide (TPR) repeat protein [Planctomycetota bacterium]|jgi:tetratricopeptide (TPR) repeat protein